ncbi:hypothetical protein Javan331_0042 [Streptococcus phage Javan331]|nr:hypothetical protein Javan331_0042 [Streptococcus phage Javan331]
MYKFSNAKSVKISLAIRFLSFLRNQVVAVNCSVVNPDVFSTHAFTKAWIVNSRVAGLMLL